MSEQQLNQTSETEVTPRVYVASLADYNAGRLLGRWIDTHQSAESIQQEINALLAESREYPAEEWAIHDYEGFGSLRLSEWESVETLAEVTRLLLEHGPVFAELVNYVGGTSNLDEARQYMEEGYQGAFCGLAEYAEQFIDDCYSDCLKRLPDFIRSHIDYEAISLDMELSGDIFTLKCGYELHVFWSRI